MSAAESAPPFDGSGEEVHGVEPAPVPVPVPMPVPETERETAFLASLPRHLRTVSAREELTREDLPRRGDSMDDPQLGVATQKVWDAERAFARCMAEKHRALAELYERDGDYEEITELDSVDTLRAGLALRVTGSAAGWQLRDAYQAVHLFPRCLEAMESGAFPSAWFQKMLKASRALSDSSRRNLDLTVSTWSPGISPERFFTLLKKLIALLEQREDRPDPCDRLRRSVDLLPSVEPGMGVLQINGPIPEILTRWKQLDESARAVQAAQRAALRDGAPIPHDPDGRVLESGRALPLSELRFLLMASAELDVDGVDVPASRFRMNIVVPALTLLGASDEPGLLDGTLPLPPSMARALAGSSETWYRVLADPATGAFLPLPAGRYQPTAAMLEHLRLRHSMCAVPGCTRPTSWASECDHIEECRRGTEGEGGLTEVENLHLLCWQHHLDKTNGLLDPARIPTPPTAPGRTRWSVGRDGDAVTVIDDLDTSSIVIAEELERAWTCFLRGSRIAGPVHEPAPPDPLPPELLPTDPLVRGAERQAPSRPGRVIPLGRPTGRDPHPAPPRSSDAAGEESSAPSVPEPPDRPPPRPDRPPPGRARRRRPSDGTEIPPGPWGEHGPPPF